MSGCLRSKKLFIERDFKPYFTLTTGYFINAYYRVSPQCFQIYLVIVQLQLNGMIFHRIKNNPRPVQTEGLSFFSSIVFYSFGYTTAPVSSMIGIAPHLPSSCSINSASSSESSMICSTSQPSALSLLLMIIRWHLAGWRSEHR